MRAKLVFLAGTLFAAVGVFASDVVPTDKPALVLKGRTLVDVQANEISGTAIGAHIRPRNMIGYNKVMLPAVNGQPAHLRVEMQMMDSYHLKCIVLELFDGAELPAAVTASVQQQVGAVEGVYGRAVAASYVLTKDHGLGWKFVNADGSLNGTAHPLVTNPKGAGVCSWSGNRFDANVWKNGTPTNDLRVVSPFRRHLYMQPCTASYTTAFWDEARWMREIDWMALHGYDLPNAVTAFEAILERVWKKHGLTDAEIEASFAGATYLAFSRMSCVDNAISHLPAAWRKRSVPLQHAIYKRLRSLGMDVMA